jgi:hypothetical protein
MSLRIPLVAYLVLLHLAVGLLIGRPDLAMRLHRALAGAVPDEAALVATMRRHHPRLAENIEPGAVLFAGSSSVQGLDVRAVVDRAVNLGIGSDTVAGVLERWPARAVEQARAVVLAIGSTTRALDARLIGQLPSSPAMPWAHGARPPPDHGRVPHDAACNATAGHAGQQIVERAP